MEWNGKTGTSIGWDIYPKKGKVLETNDSEIMPKYENKPVEHKKVFTRDLDERCTFCHYVGRHRGKEVCFFNFLENFKDKGDLPLPNKKVCENFSKHKKAA